MNDTADLILYNGRIWTCDHKHPKAEAIAIAGNQILAVGENSAILSLANGRTQKLDLAGQLVLPGFIDNHTHLMMGGLQLLTIDLRNMYTPDEFAAKIADWASGLPSGRWITGGGWDHELWPAPNLPTRQQIDPNTQNHPVFVTRMDLHMGLANTAALRLAGITSATPDPTGGMIVRDPATGEPTGILKDTAMDLVQKCIPQPTDTEYRHALHAATAHAARCGVTSVQDISSWRDISVYKKALADGELSVRIYARTPITDWEKQRDAAAHTASSEWLKLGGVKGFADGSIGSTTALFFSPYADAPENCGLLHKEMIPDGIMLQRVAEADKAGLPISVHAIGDKANHIMIDVFVAAAQKNGPRDRRFRLEHAQHLTPADIQRIASQHMIASVQPAQLLDDACWAKRRLGADRCRMAYPLRSLLDAGAKITLGTDWPVVPLDPLLGIYAAVTRRSRDGQYPNGWIPEEKITVPEAVRAYTLDSAFAEFGEKIKGSFVPGKLADLVVLSDDIFHIQPEDILHVKVLYTIAGGKIIYQA